MWYPEERQAPVPGGLLLGYVTLHRVLSAPGPHFLICKNVGVCADQEISKPPSL